MEYLEDLLGIGAKRAVELCVNKGGNPESP